MHLKQFGMPKFRLGARIGAVALALAFAASGATAAPAIAAQSSSASGGHTVIQTLKPAAALENMKDSTDCYNGGAIELPGGSAIEVTSFGTTIDVYGNHDGANQQWAVCELSDGYDAIVADYNGELMCLRSSSYKLRALLVATGCGFTVTTNEQWRRPENTQVGDGYSHLIPAYENEVFPISSRMCANVQHGIGAGHDLILYTCGSVSNENFEVHYSKSTKERIGIVEYAGFYEGYRAGPGYCNMFSAYWGDGSKCGNGLRSEEWCSDFTAYIWRKGGVSFNFKDSDVYGYLNPNSGGFYTYAITHGTWHSAKSGYKPQPGDIALYGVSGSGKDWTAQHAAVVIGISPSAAGPDAINGDWGDTVGYFPDETTNEGDPAYALSGYASPPDLG
jgi:hypothetical protein